MKLSLLISVLLFLMVSCKTYYEKSQNAHTAIEQYQFQDALEDIASNKYLRKKRNALLYHLELGRLYHLNGEYEESNKHLNYADDLMDYINTLTDLAVSVAVNSASKKYRAEDFEKIMIHYYKALNYIYLNEMEDALVEARRMNLKEMELDEKKMKQYHTDPFGMMLIGQIYEKAKDYNNAFIAYRNAYDAYVKTGKSLGVEVPKQIQEDLLRAAYLAQFYDELSYYENTFGKKYKYTPKEFGELILYWENGKAPYKIEKEYIFTLVGGQAGFYFTDQTGNLRVPFNGTVSNPSSLSALAGIRIALPAYKEFPLYYQPTPNSVTVNNNNSDKHLELVENINVIAEKTLHERFSKDLATHLTKIAMNQILAQSLRSDTTNGELGMILGTAVSAAGFLSEQADTRNWQSLPAMISYARVPLTQKDSNEVTLQLVNPAGQKEEIKIYVNSKGKNNIQFKNIFTPDKLPGKIVKPELINDTLTLKPIKP